MRRHPCRLLLRPKLLACTGLPHSLHNLRPRASTASDAACTSSPSATGPTTTTSVASPAIPMHYVRGGGCGMLQRTRVNLFLPPQLGRLLAAGGLVLGQAFLTAYAREKQRAQQQEREEAREDGGGSDSSGDGTGRSQHRRMTPLEAVQILGVEKVNPSLLEAFAPAPSSEHGSSGAAQPERHREYPVLTQARDREVARENFERMFGLAVKHNNQFLAGKLSLAFRICVDPNWDESTERLGQDDAAKGEEDAPQEERSGRKE